MWSFNSGQVAVRANPDATLTGTVIRETTLATCPHASGEQMWINVVAQPEGDALDSATVFVNGKQVKTQTGERVTAKIDLRGLPKGRYKVRLVAKTVLGRTIKGTRTYRTCAKRSGQGGGGPL